jgi:hypothetical protein
MYARIVQILAGDKVRIRFESEEVRHPAAALVCWCRTSCPCVHVCVHV